MLNESGNEVSCVEMLSSLRFWSLFYDDRKQYNHDVFNLNSTYFLACMFVKEIENPYTTGNDANFIRNGFTISHFVISSNNDNLVPTESDNISCNLYLTEKRDSKIAFIVFSHNSTDAIVSGSNIADKCESTGELLLNKLSTFVAMLSTNDKSFNILEYDIICTGYRHGGSLAIQAAILLKMNVFSNLKVDKIITFSAHFDDTSIETHNIYEKHDISFINFVDSFDFKPNSKHQIPLESHVVLMVDVRSRMKPHFESQPGMELFHHFLQEHPVSLHEHDAD